MFGINSFQTDERNDDIIINASKRKNGKKIAIDKEIKINVHECIHSNFLSHPELISNQCNKINYELNRFKNLSSR